MDSLRYWATEMRVDGFRFDLAATLAREFYDVDRLAAFFDVVQQDPVISQSKLIAEPWDVGPGGYQVGQFPPLWTEWNGKYRDTVRDFWRGEPATVGEFASRITGSSDLYQHDGRRPYASINFITAHDGFTLNDLVSYNHKHNEANGEDNRDGADDNRSWNCGVEGPTDDPEVNELRARQRRNLLASLLLSQGVPMLLGGDEIGRTQGGNNNAYCQDNEISWVDWTLAESHAELAAFTAAVSEFRRAHPVFRRRRFFAGRTRQGDELRDIVWFSATGTEMADQDWAAPVGRCVMVFLNGQGIPDLDMRGEPVTDSSFLLGFNADPEDVNMVLPGRAYGERWAVVLDTATGEVPAAGGTFGGVTALGSLGSLNSPLGAVTAGTTFDLMEGARVVEAKATLKVAGRSLVVLQRSEPSE
jgi:glycogen operon protein